MSLIQKETEQYRATSANGYDWENRDCVIRAYAVLTGKSYETIHKLAAKHGRKEKQGTSDRTIRLMANELGLELVPYGWKVIARRGKYTLDYPTLAQHLRDKPSVDCLIVRKGHAFAIKDGIVRDWATGTGARSRIQYYIRHKQQP